MDKLLFIYFLIGCIQASKNAGTCDNHPGTTKSVCKNVMKCLSALEDISNGIYPTLCGFEGIHATVCCPLDSENTINSKSIESCRNYTKLRCLQGTENNDSKNPVDRTLIVGGKVSSPKEFPHMALIGYGDYSNVRWDCGGTLVSEEYVLSAGHCSYSGGIGAARWVRLGELDLDSVTEDAKPRDFEISKIIVHPDYNKNSFYNDITLFKLHRKVKFSEYIFPICLENMKNFPVQKSSLIATGWGSIGYGEATSNIMRNVNLDLISHSSCKSSYGFDNLYKNGIVDDKMICAGVRTGAKDTCLGDSGGPLQYLKPEGSCGNMYVQVGITSFGKECANQNLPGIYTRVSHYIPWIESIVWS